MKPEPQGGEFTRSIIGAFFDVYNELGFGLLESVYSAALEFELRARGHHVEREFWTDVFYKGHAVSRQRLDMIVNGTVVLEIKATERLPNFARRQLLNYLTATRLDLGLILHFGPAAKVYRLINTRYCP